LLRAVSSAGVDNRSIDKLVTLTAVALAGTAFPSSVIADGSAPIRDAICVDV
jgi:hypothetical protein